MTLPEPTRARAKKPSKNRQKLIASARDLMARRGYAATGTEAIVRAAGVTRGALYYQFVDKADLFRAVCEEELVRVVQRLSDETMERAKHPEDELRIGALLMLDYFGEPETAQILIVDGPSVLGFESWRACLQPVMLGLLHHGLDHQVEAGKLAPDQVEPFAQLLFGSLTQASVAIGTARHRETTRRRYRKSVTSLLAGIARA